MILSMVKAKGKLTVEEHEKTHGIIIKRKTPELRTREQKVIIPGSNVSDVLNQIAETQNVTVVENEVASALAALEKAIE